MIAAFVCLVVGLIAGFVLGFRVGWSDCEDDMVAKGYVLPGDNDAP